MTYAGFLLRFVGIPIAILFVWAVLDARRSRHLPSGLRGWPVWVALLGHSLVALIYTTPWDNYLVASGVWWYDPALVTGITLGWVPLEEYVFFVLQPIMTGLLLVTVFRYTALNEQPLNSRVRPILLVGPAILWLASAVMLISQWQPGTYLGLILVWALPPVMLQLAFGGDILWRHRRVVFAVIATSTLYLATADYLAISSGTWTIDPAQSLAVPKLAGVLPLEEFIFFLMTNILVTFGTTLVLAEESHARFRALVQRLRSRSGGAEKNHVDLAV